MKERPRTKLWGIREQWARSDLEWDDDGKACFAALQEATTGPDWNHTWVERDARVARRSGACRKKDLQGQHGPLRRGPSTPMQRVLRPGSYTTV